jgi:hypothetical protein
MLKYMKYIEDAVEGYFYYEIAPKGRKKKHVIYFDPERSWLVSISKKETLPFSISEAKMVFEDLELDMELITQELKKTTILLIMYNMTQIAKAQDMFGLETIQEAKQTYKEMNRVLGKTIMSEIEHNIEPEVPEKWFDNSGKKGMLH